MAITQKKEVKAVNLLNGNIKPIYFKYLSAAFGSAMITSVYSLVDMAMVGQYQGSDGTAILFFDKPILLFFGADESLLALAETYLMPVKVVVPLFLFNQMLAAFLRNDNHPERPLVC